MLSKGIQLGKLLKNSCKIIKKLEIQAPKFHYQSLLFQNHYSFAKKATKGENPFESKLSNIQNLISTHGEKSIQVANAYTDLMNSYVKAGDLAKAIDAGQKGINALIGSQGENSLEVASAFNNIACLRKYAGQFVEAGKDFEKAIEIAKNINNKISSEHLYVFRKSYSELLLETGQYMKAFKELKAGHDDVLEKFGDKHPGLIDLKYSIARSLLELSMFRDALDYLNDALNLSKQVHKDGDSFQARIYNSIGVALLRQGKGAEARENIIKADEIYSKFQDAPDLGISIQNNFGYLYTSIGEHKKALESFTKAKELTESTYGTGHIGLAMIYSNIGESHYHLNNFNQALDNHNKSKEITIKYYGTDHPMLGHYNSSVGQVYQKMGEAQLALDYFKKSAEIREKHLGDSHYETANSYNDIGQSLFQLGDFNTAFVYMMKALPIYEKALPPHHPNTLRAYLIIGTIYNRLGHQEKALEFLNKCLKIAREHYGDDSTVANCLNNIGLVYAAKRDFAEALKYLKESLEVKKKLYGEDDAEIAQSCTNIAGMQNALNQLEDAIKNYEKALEIYRKVLGNDHFYIGNISSNLGVVYSKLGNNETALKYLEEARDNYKKSLGEENHYYTAVIRAIEETKSKL